MNKTGLEPLQRLLGPHFPNDLDRLNLGPDRNKALQALKQQFNTYFQKPFKRYRKIDNLQQAKYLYLLKLIDLVAADFPEDIARRQISLADSYNRLPLLIALHRKMPASQWFRLFFDFWQDCDACALHNDAIQSIVLSYSMDEIRSYYDDTQRKIDAALPDLVTIYRCELNTGEDLLGMAWTTERETADMFGRMALNTLSGGSAFLRMMFSMNAKDFQRMQQTEVHSVHIYQAIVPKDQIICIEHRDPGELICAGLFDSDVECLQTFIRKNN